MNYLIIYNNLVAKRKLNKPNGYTEKHHIIPKSMGGLNSKENIVCFTAKEHFIAHRLLYKIYRNKEMAFALNLMCSVKNKSQNRHKINSKQYQTIRADYIDTISGKNHPNYGTKLSEAAKKKISINTKKGMIGKEISSGFKGHKHSDDFKQKLSLRNKGISRTDEDKLKIKINQPALKGVILKLNGMTMEFISSKDAAEALGFKSGSNIRRWCRENHIITRGLNKGMEFSYGC